MRPCDIKCLAVMEAVRNQLKADVKAQQARLLWRRNREKCPTQRALLQAEIDHLQHAIDGPNPEAAAAAAEGFLAWIR